ncbi:MAG: radical SAM protein [Verrucomicrobiae bacterium]|nr:radical SAM protein [Verrucomicrobiae bacterium]
MDLIQAHLDHRRSYQDFLYVYPVISRRSRGVSIGINLNPDKICNFDCVYCEVDRNALPRTRKVDLAILEQELMSMIKIYQSKELFKNEPFSSAPLTWRRLNDIAFSGDGEPTTYSHFDQAVEIAWRAREKFHLSEVKLVLITDAACLDRPVVKSGIGQMAQGPHEIWAKLDAGTVAYYKLVNRTAISLDRIIKNITETANKIPLWIQTLFLQIHGKPPSDEEISAYIHQLASIQKNGGKILGIQIYTVARPTPETWATALTNEQLDAIALRVEQESGLKVERFYGAN